MTGLADILHGMCRFPASPDPRVFAAQQTLVEAWSIIEDAYVDAQFGGHQWDDELSNALVATFAAEDGEGAYKQISNMLSKLGDPFTRIVPASCVSPSFCPSLQARHNSMQSSACSPSLMHINTSQNIVLGCIPGGETVPESSLCLVPRS